MKKWMLMLVVVYSACSGDKPSNKNFTPTPRAVASEQEAVELGTSRSGKYKLHRWVDEIGGKSIVCYMVTYGGEVPALNCLPVE